MAGRLLGSTDQSWQLSTLANGNLSIVDRNSGKSLGIYQASKAGGAQAVQWTANTSADQQWSMVQSGTSWQIKNVNSGLVLSVQGSTADGANVVQTAAGTGSDQRWRLVQLSNQ
ncbi:RICIN domain-containing protein [Curtobacterium sp. B18]|uniref:RICIN domain-containing protein n=1 Tax=Curtobacterium sp. B18 TaxID=95614 RepID=UPI0003460250|nr:RICIN domain-containing protein [Curtobacterium sp. B18]